MTPEVGTHYLGIVREKASITIEGMPFRPHEDGQVGVQKVLPLGNLELRTMDNNYTGEGSDKITQSSKIASKWSTSIYERGRGLPFS